MAKSNIRSTLLKRIGITTKKQVVGLVNNALENGTTLNTRTTDFREQFTKQVEFGGETLNVSFIKRQGEEVAEFTSLTFSGGGADKLLKGEISRLNKLSKE